MKKIFLEIIFSATIVFFCTPLAYSLFSGRAYFWSAQLAWSFALAVCWILVSAGYYHQGLLVHKHGNSENVSLMLPVTVFAVQCILFVKGIFYQDWSLIFGAVIVNSGVLFSAYQIFKHRNRVRRRLAKLRR